MLCNSNSRVPKNADIQVALRVLCDASAISALKIQLGWVKGFLQRRGRRAGAENAEKIWLLYCCAPIIWKSYKFYNNRIPSGA
jgi:hypothetical protein